MFGQGTRGRVDLGLGAGAIWPAIDPVAPAAAVTSTASPSTGRPMSVIPKYAVRPVIPSSPSIISGCVTPAGTGSKISSPAGSSTT